MVQVTETARENARMYGIERAKIEDTVEFSTGENAKTLTAPWDTEYTLHRGGPHLASDRKDYFVIVLTEERDGETVALSVHVVPERIPTDSRDSLELLWRLANSGFGLSVSVWGNRGRFFSVEDEKPLMQVGTSKGVKRVEDPPEGHAVALEDWTRQLEDGEIQVLLAFAVDTTAVREDLGL